MPPLKTGLKYAKLSYFFFALILITNSWNNLVPRVLSYPPYVGRVGQDPGNEVARESALFVNRNSCLL